MCIDPLANPLRAEAERALHIRVQVSRFGGLYFSQRTASDPSLMLLSAESCPNGIILHPTHQAIQPFEDWAAPHVSQDDLGQSLARLSGQATTQPELILFALGMKQLELKAPTSAWRAYEKKLRQLTADCLREKHGGGALHACWACMALTHSSETPRGEPL